MKLNIKSDAEKLGKSIGEYQVYSGRDMDDTLEKQGGKFARFLSKELRGIAPARGSIRSRRISAMKSGSGTLVRESILKRVYAKYGVRTRLSDRKLVFGKRGVVTNKKGLNIQNLAVKAELNIRESGIGFLSVSAMLFRIAAGVTSVKSRYGPRISQASLFVKDKKGKLTFTWGAGGPLSESASEGLMTEGGQKAINEALKKTTADIMEYVDRKKSEHIKKAGL